MKRTYACIIIFMLVISIFDGCGKQEVIHIGVVGTMTGNQSDLSVSGRRGLEIAVEEVNSKGGINGKQVELTVKDDRNDPERAKEIVGEFINEDIHIVIGHYTSGMMLAAYDEVIKNDILYLGPTISADGLSEIDDNFIRFIASTKEQAQIINDVANKLGQKDFFVIVDGKNSGFNEMLYANFEELLIQNGGKIMDEYSYTKLDDSSITDIKKMIDKCTSADSIFVIASASDLGTITQEIRKEGCKMDLYGPLWSHTTDLLRVGGEYAENIKVVSGIDYESTTEVFNLFSEKFKNRYGSDATFASIYSYEAFMALAMAMEMKNSDNPEEVKEQLITIGSFKGLQQSFNIDEYGDNTRQYMMDQIINGKFVRID